MKVKGLREEDFLQYKKPAMFIIFPYCTGKCNVEYGSQICQNWKLQEQSIIDVDAEDLVKRYILNPITTSIVMGGLEPMDSIWDVITLLDLLRNKYGCEDDVVIFTGYYPYEIQEEINKLSKFKNVIIKFGRFIPNNTEHYDEVLGVMLGSDNQYAERIS